MRTILGPLQLMLIILLLSAGCQDKGSMPTPRADTAADTVQANLDKLGPEDKTLAAAQGYCAVESEHRLGVMGTPVKITLNGQAVFLCCKSCMAEAKEHAEKTLANVEALKAKVKRASAN